MSIISKIRRLVKSTSEVIPNVYQLTNKATNVILIVEDELTLIDTGLRGSSSQIMDFIQYLERSPQELSLIILTHNHIDHIGGLTELKQQTSARVAIHKLDISDLETETTSDTPKHKPPLRPFSSTLRSVFTVKSDDIDMQLEGGEILPPLGGLEVMHTPGHTPGSISLYSRQNKLIFTGDAIRKRHKAFQFPPKMASSDLVQAAESIKRIAQLDFNILCPGHGLPVSDNVHAKIQDLIERSKY